MQRNTARIVEKMNYKDVEPHLLSCFILTYYEWTDIVKEQYRDRKLYIIDKVFKGTEETFENFLKALEKSQNSSNRQLMIHLRQDLEEEQQSMPLSHAEMLNTISSSMENELVFGETPTQSPVTWLNGRFEPSSYTAVHHRLSHQGTTQQEQPSVVSRNSPTSPLSINGAPDPQDSSWVIIQTLTNNIPYSKNLVLLMEYICKKLMEALEGTNCVQQIQTSIMTPVKLAKVVYLEADRNRATRATRAADNQIRESYKLLLKILQQLQEPGYPDIRIDLNPILNSIGYSPDIPILSECNIEGLILAVDELNQKTRLCLIL